MTQATLFLVHGEDPDNVTTNLDLFVWAADETAAVAHWDGYYDGWDKPDKVEVFQVPTTGMIGAVPWDVVVRTTVAV